MDNEALMKARAAIDSIDLKPIEERLYRMYGWPEENAKEGCEQYKNFLYLNIKYKGSMLPPSLGIDEVWHAHVLYTKQYANDCEAVFGRYFHHTPGNATNSTATDESAFENAFKENTLRLYEEEFGQPLMQVLPSGFEKFIEKIRRLLVKVFGQKSATQATG